MSRLTNFVIIAAAIIAAAGGIVLFLREDDTGEPIRIIPPSTVSSDASRPQSEAKAYVTGAVRRPGLYTVGDGDRLADLIDLAGGATEDADLRAINMAVRVRDQDHWTVPSVAESGTAPSNTDHVRSPSGKVDINTADAKLLETLPGIGEVRARAIIHHRERHGPFKRVEDIIAVSGIGPANLESLRDLVETR